MPTMARSMVRVGADLDLVLDDDVARLQQPADAAVRSGT